MLQRGGSRLFAWAGSRCLEAAERSGKASTSGRTSVSSAASTTLALAIRRFASPGERPAGEEAAGTNPYSNPGGPVMDVFDRALKQRHRDRAARLCDEEDPLLCAVSERLLDRLEDCTRKFPTAVILGGTALQVARSLIGGRAGIERVICVDTSTEMLRRVQVLEARDRKAAGGPTRAWPAMHYVAGDEEFLPIKAGSVDLIISCLGLHWANDLPGAMSQARAALKPDGLFLAALFGGDTLHELRVSCALAQMERLGGVSPVVSPLAQVRDAGNLLTRAGLTMPTVDVDSFQLGYASALELVSHLRALGESNGVINRQRLLKRDAALAAAAVYQTMFGYDDGGSVSATYQVMFMTGWAPHPSQPKAAKRGSATVSFQDLATGLLDKGALAGTADGVVPPAGVSGGGHSKEVTTEGAPA